MRPAVVDVSHQSSINRYQETLILSFHQEAIFKIVILRPY